MGEIELKIMEETLEVIEKAPRYFLVHFYERHIVFDNRLPFGVPFAVCHNDVWVNVYGIPPEKRENFNPIALDGHMVGIRHIQYHWVADNVEDLMKKLEEDLDYSRGILRLHEDVFLKRGSIEHLPECEKMHLNSKTGDLLCGKPRNENNDGCMGGCVLQSYDQDEYPFEGFKCPVQDYWSKNSQEKIVA